MKKKKTEFLADNDFYLISYSILPYEKLIFYWYIFPCKALFLEILPYYIVWMKWEKSSVESIQSWLQNSNFLSTFYGGHQFKPQHSSSTQQEYLSVYLCAVIGRLYTLNTRSETASDIKNKVVGWERSFLLKFNVFIIY